MSKSTGIVLAATSISFVNKWASSGDVDLGIPIAGGFVSLLFSGIEEINETAGVGLAWLMMITVVLSTPKGGTAPPQTVLKWLGMTPQGNTKPLTAGLAGASFGVSK